MFAYKKRIEGGEYKKGDFRQIMADDKMNKEEKRNALLAQFKETKAELAERKGDDIFPKCENPELVVDVEIPEGIREIGKRGGVRVQKSEVCNIS